MKNPETKPVVTKIIVSLLVAAAAFGIGIASGAFASAGSAFENFSLNGKASLRVILIQLCLNIFFCPILGLKKLYFFIR